ncbi:translational regulator orb2-like isoform X3 [Scaptodrosophila lebanonensis]|uniref:Translational regulator orb2-like isoform X3 n=1 Tax=Drosophila lebanonensis TaxID=7225 RepID=A0A6J2UCU0_DROLE|nr:translational regulator orb2-like isoform X3 [Scaptodrosophila lebanonensis]
MDSLKLPKANSATNSATGSNSNLSCPVSGVAVSGNSAAASPTTTKPPPGMSSTPIAVRFNANEESLDDILQSFHQNKHSPSGGIVMGGGGGGGDASPTLLGSANCMKNNGSMAASLGLNAHGMGGMGGPGNACDSLSSSPSQHQQLQHHQQQQQQHQQQQAAALFGQNEDVVRNNFLPSGFFNRKSCGGLPPNLNLNKPPPQQLQQQQQQQQQQLSPNLSALHQQQRDGGGPHSPSSPGGGGSPYNGSQAGCSSGGISPIPQMSGVSPKYRRSISFPVKGNSPTAMYGGVCGGGPTHMDAMGIGGGGGGPHMNIPTLSIGNGGANIMGTAGATGGGDAPYLGSNYGNMMGGGGGGGSGALNGQMHHGGAGMGGMDNTLCDYMRGMSLGGGGGGDNMVGMMGDRMRGGMGGNPVGGSKHLSEVDAMAIAAGNDPSLYLNALKMGSPSRLSPHSPHSPIQGGNGGGAGDGTARFSRKVFVGGLPPDIDEDEITTSFRRFGPLVVDWPHKAESKSYFPPKGYAFLLFQDESSVQQLIDSCITDEDKLYLCVSSPTIKDKAVQIRPWRLADADYVLDATMSLDPRKTVFVGGVPRPLKAFELAMIMDRLYGGVCYAGIDTDPELKYPKGAGRVAFSNQQSYIAAISARFVQLQHGDIDKRVEVKPYVLDDQMCDECEGQRCGGKFAPFFCANVTCLQYYCEHCWAVIHSRPGREYHKPLVKEGADRPRAVPFRWC